MGILRKLFRKEKRPGEHQKDIRDEEFRKEKRQLDRRLNRVSQIVNIYEQVVSRR